jgi:hypothetical protein
MSIYIHDEAARLRLRVTGTLDDPSARELLACWQTAGSVVSGRKVVADLTQLAGGSGDAGREVLAQLHEEGVEFLVRTVEQQDLVEEATGSKVGTSKASKPVGKRLKELLSR